jgi:Chaperone of endosialidase
LRNSNLLYLKNIFSSIYKMDNKEVLYTLALVVSLLILYHSQQRRQSLSKLAAASTTPPRLVIGNKLRFGLKLDQGSQSISISNTGTHINTSNQPTMVISADGKVGIGTTAPSTRLHINGGNIEVGSITFDNTAITEVGSVRIGSSTSNDLVIPDSNVYLTGDSKLGIGTTSPSYTLDATNSATFNLGRAFKMNPRTISTVNYSAFMSSGTLTGPSNGLYTFTSATRYGTVAIEPSVSTSSKVKLTIHASSNSISTVPNIDMPTVSARYVRIRFATESRVQRNPGLAEVKVYDYTLTNLIKTDTPTTCSSVLSGFVSKNVTDNDPSTFWHPVNDWNPWIKLDLGSDQRIYMVTITARQESILYSRQLGLVVEFLNDAGSVVYTSTPAHSPTGKIVYGEGGSDGYPYYSYLPALGTLTNGLYTKPIIETTVLSPVPPPQAAQIFYDKTYFVIHDGSTIHYTSPYLTSTLTTYTTPTLTRANLSYKLFLTVVGEKNVTIQFSASVNDYILYRDGALFLPSVPLTTSGPIIMTRDGDALTNEYSTHTLALKSAIKVHGSFDKQLHLLFDADTNHQAGSIQSLIQDTSLYNLVLNPRGGNVGMGTTNPTNTLHINGKVKGGYRHNQYAVYQVFRDTDNDKWFRIASFTGMTYGEFLLSWQTPGDHGELRFNLACSYNQYNTINIIGGTLYNYLIDNIRIATDNSSIYNTNYIEVHARAGVGSWYWDSADLNVQVVNVGPITGNLYVFPIKTAGTTSGYTYYTASTVASFSTQQNGRNMMFNGSLGIGTISPAYTIDVVDNTKYLTTRLQSNASDTRLDMVSAGEGWRISSTSNSAYVTGSILFQRIGGGTPMVILPNGRVGIGTTNPSSGLEVYGNSLGDGGGNYVTARHLGTGESVAQMRLYNNVGLCYWFLNASNRSGDGGGNLATMRNDWGRMRFQNAASQSTIMLDGTATSFYASVLNFNSAVGFNGNTALNDTVTMNGLVSFNGGLNMSGSNMVIYVPTTINGSTAINGSSLSVRETTINGSTTINGAWFTPNANNVFNGWLWAQGKLIIQNSVNGGSGRGIWLWNSGDSSWGIYMADSGSWKALNDGTAPAGSGFIYAAVRFRAGDWHAYGFIFENSSNETVASIRASDGYTFFKSLWTNSVNYNRLYANDWFRHTSSGGVYWQSYAQGLQATGNGSGYYGSISNSHEGRNGYYGYAIGDVGTFMTNGYSVFGIHKLNYGWIIRCEPYLYTDCYGFQSWQERIYIGSTYTYIYHSANTQIGEGFYSEGKALFDQSILNGNVSVKSTTGKGFDVNGSARVNGSFNTQSWGITPSLDSSSLQIYNDYGHVSSINANGSWWRGSDLRIKASIKPLNSSNSLKTILSLLPVSYLQNKQSTVGFIPQHVQQVNPYCVTEHEFKETELELNKHREPIVETDEHGTPITDKYGAVKYKTVVKKTEKKLGICYEDLYIHSINVVQEQQKDIDSKQSRIQQLTNQIAQQNLFIEKLNAGISALERLVR